MTGREYAPWAVAGVVARPEAGVGAARARARSRLSIIYAIN
jgi:hypothetical protein